MMIMNRPKLGPARAQTTIQKRLYFLCFSNTLVHLLANAALHIASALRAPLANIVKKTLVLLLFDDFHNSVLKLQDATYKNAQNDLAQVLAGTGPNENSKSLYFLCVFYVFAHGCDSCCFHEL